MNKLIRAGVIWLFAMVSPATAQTTIQHNSKVQVKPNGTTTYADSMRVWGGGQFGAGGAVQTINIDGTLNASAAISAGSLTLSMLGDSGCSSGQIPKYNGSAWVCDTDIVGGGGGGGTLSSISLVMPSAEFGVSPGTLTADGTFTVTWDTQSANTVFAGPTTGSAATPAFRALVAADLPTAVTQTSDNEVITGSWRFNANTVFGDSTTAQQLVHIYKATAQAGLSIEKGDETERWDILANTNGLQIVEATGGLVPLTFKSNRIGVFNASPTAGYEIDLTGDLKISGNISLGSYFENSLIPSVGDTYNLGDVTRPWSQAYISTLNATVFAEATATIFGGYSIVGRNSGTLAAAAASGDTTIYLDKDGTSLPVSGDTWIVIRAHDSSGSVTPKTEYIKLISVGTCTGTAPNLSCPWSVARDQTSAHATDPAWPVGTPFLFLGSNGDGRIELYAVSGLPRLSILRQSTTASSSTDIIRLGGLDGVAGMSSVTGRYGIFIGEGTTNYMKFQKNVGGGGAVGDDDKLIVQGTINAIAGQFGSGGTNYVNVDATGLSLGNGAIRGGATSYSSGTGIWIGDDAGTYKLRIGTTAGNRFTWDGTTAIFAGNGSGLTSINGGNIQTDTITASQIAADAITVSELAANSVTASELAANSVTAADILAGTITATELATGSVTATKISVTNLSAISADLGSITSGTVTGATLQTATTGARVVINSISGLTAFNSSGVTQLQIDTGNGRLTAGAGAVTLDASGFLWKNSGSEVIGQVDSNGILLGNQSATTYSGYGTEDGYKFYMVDDASNQSGLFGVYRSAGGTNKTVALRSVWYGGTSGSIGTGKATALLYAEGATWTGSRTALPAYIDVTAETAGTSEIRFALPVGGVLAELTESAFLINTSAAVTGQLKITGSAGNSTYFDATYGNTINFAYGSNANNAGWINYRGYNGGTTQFRDLYIGDGKGNVLAVFDGSEGTLDINELTTTSAFYPFVSDNGILRAKSDGVNATVTCTAGSNIVFVVEYGIVTSITGSGCS